MADKNMNAKISVDFEESASRQSLNSGDSLPTLFGKTKKFLSDLKPVALTGSYNDLTDIPDSTSILNTATGNPITITDGADAPLIELGVYGKSVQDGTPTPDVPIDIVNVGDDGNVKITSHGKNIFDFDKWKNITYVADATYTIIDNGITVTVKSTIPTGDGRVNSGYLIDVTPGKIYTLSMDTVTNQGYAVVYGNNNSDIAKLYATGTRCHLTFIVPSDVTQVRILLRFDRANETNTFSNFQLEEGSTATAYVPYGNTATITSGLPLCSIGDVRDELVYRADGTGKIIKRTAKIVLDGSNDEAWVTSEGNAPFQITISDGSLWESRLDLPRLYCNKYQRVPQGATWGSYDYMVSTDTNGTLLAIRDISVTTLEGFKAKLNAVPMVVVYVLATPQEIELSAAEMSELMQLQTFDGVTNIYNDENADLYIKYWCDNNINTLLNSKAPLTHTHTVSDIVDFPETPDTSNLLSKTGDVMEGILIAQSNADYTIAQVRNVTMSTEAASGGSNGQIHYQYE